MTDRRPITPLVRRRAWGEVGVRSWTFLTIVLTVAAVAVAYSRWAEWNYEKRVIETGTPVSAEVAVIGLGDLAKQGSRDEMLNVELRYTVPGASTPTAARGILPRRPGQVLALKDVLRVNVDPAKPDYWTERTAPPPLGLAMITPLLCGGIALACLLIAFAKRAAVLRAFKTAELKRATVRSVRQSPLAPFSKLVAVTLDYGDDRRVRDCLWPSRLGPIHPKQPIDVLASKRRTFAAAAYGEASAAVSGSVLE